MFLWIQVVLVLMHGGASLTLCFNTVAILFIMDLDNVLYRFAIPNYVRAEIEAHGRFRDGVAIAAQASAAKPLHIAVVCIYVPSGVSAMEGLSPYMDKQMNIFVFFYTLMPGLVLFWPLLEVLIYGGFRTNAIIKACCTGCASAFGFVAFISLAVYVTQNIEN